MNANELADDMENGMFNDINYNKKKAADFIRQQQAEIEALKKEAALQRLSDFTQEAENEPVAWMLVDKSWNDFCRYSSYPTEGAIPLYTHPAKTLTDEEIIETYAEIDGRGIIEFARAILRKAQEK